jgi:hypothetical protein
MSRICSVCAVKKTRSHDLVENGIEYLILQPRRPNDRPISARGKTHKTEKFFGYLTNDTDTAYLCSLAYNETDTKVVYGGLEMKEYKMSRPI